MTRGDYQKLREMAGGAHEALSDAVELTNEGGATRGWLLRACLDIQDALRAWDAENHEDSMRDPPLPPPKTPDDKED